MSRAKGVVNEAKEIAGEGHKGRDRWPGRRSSSQAGSGRCRGFAALATTESIGWGGTQAFQPFYTPGGIKRARIERVSALCTGMTG
ncbi:MAG: hypothetical protein ABW084_16805 [Candidatus Thiodiazotropha sp.]